MARRRGKKVICLHCAVTEQLERTALKVLKAKNVRIDKLAHVLNLLRDHETLQTCKCGRNVIAGERVGALLDHVHGS